MSKVLKLKEPIQFGSELISELKFEKPRAKHFRKLPAKPDTGDILDLAGQLCKQPPSVMDELSVEDMLALVETVKGFFPSGLATGNQP